MGGGKSVLSGGRERRTYEEVLCLACAVHFHVRRCRCLNRILECARRNELESYARSASPYGCACVVT
eukprot:5159681-Pyramimonas_sp.AAC.1